MISNNSNERLSPQDFPILTNIILVIAVIIVEAYFLSPAVSYYKYNKGQINFKNLPSVTIFSNLVNCILWLILGSQRVDIQMLICNSIGFFFSIVLVACLWFISSKNHFFEYLIYLFTLYNIIFQVFYILFSVFPEKGTEILIGNILFNAGMYLSTAQNIFTAIKLQDPNLLPAESLITGLTAAILFSLYGYLDGDFSTMISNLTSVGVLIPIFSIWLWLYLKKKKIDKIKREIGENMKLLNEDQQNII